MGSAQSTHTTSEIKEIPQKEEAPPRNVSGRKESTADSVLGVEPQMISANEEDADSDASSDSESDDDFDDSEDEEGGKKQRLHDSLY